MRSIATPNDHIDMMKRMKPTPFAMGPIDCHIAIKSTVQPPSRRGSKFEKRLTRFDVYCKVKFTVTVMMTGTGTPFSRVGVNCHCFTASSAAASSKGIERSTFASCTAPFGPIVASMMTTPCTRADCAIAGYTGFTSFTFVGCLMLPPTRTGAGGGGGGGGGGGASASPPTMPPVTPPTMPPSTPTTALLPVSMPVSGLISLGASTGAAFGLTSITGLGAAAACGGGGGGGRGGRGRRNERHHRRRRGQHIGRHQRNDHDGRDDHRVNDDRQRHRIPLLAAHFDRGLDDIAEHVTWHGVSPQTPSRSRVAAFLLEGVSNQRA